MRMKLAAFRDKDRVHLRDLVSVGLIEANRFQDLPPLIKGRLEHILATPED